MLQREPLLLRLRLGVVYFHRVRQHADRRTAARGAVERRLAPVDGRALGHVSIRIDEEAKLPLARARRWLQDEERVLREAA
jgi:hypothetical protein